MTSAIQHESAISIHMSPLSWTYPPCPLHPTPRDYPQVSCWGPSVMYQLSISYLFYMCVCAYMHAHCVLSRVWLFWNPLDSSPPTVGIFRPEYWNGLPFTTQGDHPDPGIEPESLVSPELWFQWFLYHYTTWEAPIYFVYGNVYVSMLLSQFIPPPPSPTVSKVSFLCLHLHSSVPFFISTIVLDSIYMH